MAEASGKASSRKFLTDVELKALKPGQTATDSLPGRGSGSILFECRASGAIEAYYRRRGEGGQKIKVGVFKKTPKSPGLSLTEIREQAVRLAKIAAEHGDIKAYQAKCAAEEEARQAERQRQLHEQQRLAEIEASKGTLSELFRDYIEDRRRNGVSAQQLDEFERVLRNDLEGEKVVSVADDGQVQKLNVMAMKAKDVRPEHVNLLLKPIWERGAGRQTGKVRSFLVAAFNFGLKAEHHIDRSSNKSFGLQMNPADAVTVPNTSMPGERALTDKELKHFWQTITQVGPVVGPIMARVFHFAFATAGQRPLQFIREPWASYNLEDKYLKIIDSKGRGGKKRPHFVPLSSRAVQVLEQVRALQPPGAKYPWSVGGKKPIHASSLSHAVNEWFATEHAKLDGQPVPKFTPRDIRRTCTQFMQRHGIENPDSDALQSHGQTGVVETFYRNNPEAKLPQMRPTMEAFDAALGRLLDSSDEDEHQAEQLDLFEIG